MTENTNEKNEETEERPEKTFDEWYRFREAYIKALQDRGFRRSETASRRPMELHSGRESTTEKTIVPSDPIGIGTTPNHPELKMPFKALARRTTDTHTISIRPTRTVRSWCCVVCGAENPSGDRDNERTYLCRNCERDVRKALSKKAEVIFGGGKE